MHHKMGNVGHRHAEMKGKKIRIKIMLLGMGKIKQVNMTRTFHNRISQTSGRHQRKRHRTLTAT